MRALTGAVSFFRRHSNRALRIVTVVVALCGWLALSNRCALGRVLLKQAAAAAVEHSCCKTDAPQPGNAPKFPGNAECCKALDVLILDGAKLPGATRADVPAVPIVCLLRSVAQSAESEAPRETGSPPDVPGFAELILHRSLRSHAPPAAA